MTRRGAIVVAAGAVLALSAVTELAWRRAERSLDATRVHVETALAARSVRVVHAATVRSGWPFAARLTLPRLRVEGAAGTLTADGVVFARPIVGRGAATAALVGPATIALAGKPTFRLWAADLVARRRPDMIGLDADALRVAPENAGPDEVISVGRLAFRAACDASGGTEIALEAGALRLPDHGGGRAGARLDALDLRMRFAPQPDGRVRVEAVVALRPGGVVTVRGTWPLPDRGTADELDLTLPRDAGDALVRAMAEIGVLDAGERQAVAGLLAFLAAPDGRVDLRLDIREGAVRLGPYRLGSPDDVLGAGGTMLASAVVTGLVSRCRTASRPGPA